MRRIKSYVGELKRLPSTRRRVNLVSEEIKQSGNYFQQEIEKLNHRLIGLENDKLELQSQLEKTKEANENKIIELRHRIDILKKQPIKNTPADSEPKQKDQLAYNHILDNFYMEFERNYRGSEEEILSRQEVYLPLFRDLTKKKNYKILDIGCGRGEFLARLKANGHPVVGIDLNSKMVEATKKKGIVAYEQDALSYLAAQDSKSIGSITGFHIVEHIPFEELMAIFEECYRTLNDGGFVVFETPNPENVLVGSNRFYNDPSHIKPIPPTILDFMLKTVGFKTEIRRLHPERNDDELARQGEGLLLDIARHIYGPQDYSVVGYR